MRKLNYKTGLIALAAVILAVVVIVIVVEKNKTSDNEDQALARKDVAAENTSSFFSYINPYSSNNKIEFLAPKNAALDANINQEPSDETLYVYNYDINSKEISSSPVSVDKPLKVVWGKDGSIAYLSDNNNAYFYDKTRSGQTKVLSKATDISLSSDSGLLSASDDQEIFITRTSSPDSPVATLPCTGEFNTSSGVENGIVFKSENGWKLYSEGVTTSLEISGSNSVPYSQKNEVVILENDESSFIFDVVNNRKISDIYGQASPNIFSIFGNSTIFSIIEPSQSEDQTNIYCFNTRDNTTTELYTSNSTLNLIDASSVYLNANSLYFTWGNQLFSIKINDNLLNKCKS